MSFAQENGYTPRSFESLMDLIRQGVNEKFSTSYTEDTFVGTNWYKFAYPIVQKLQENEVKTSEIFSKLQAYIAVTNERVQRPSVSLPGLIEAFESEGYVASVRPATEANRGLIAIAINILESIAGIQAEGFFTITDFAALISGTDDSVTVGATVFTAQSGAVTPGGGTFQAATSNAATAESLASQINAHATAGALVRAKAIGAKVLVRALLPGTAGNAIALAYTDNDTNVGATKSGTALVGGTDAAAGYAAIKTEICGLIRTFVEAGIVSEGDQSEAVVLTNGQSFDFKFNLPFRLPIELRLTATESDNSTVATPSDEDLRQAIFDQVGERYRMGWNFEPQRYYNLSDAQWAEELVLEYSFDGGSTWTDEVYESEFDELLTFELGDISVVI